MEYRLYSNRAACYLKLNDNEHCIQDASRVSSVRDRAVAAAAATMHRMNHMWSVIIMCPAGTGVVLSCCTIQSYSES